MNSKKIGPITVREDARFEHLELTRLGRTAYEDLAAEGTAYQRRIMRELGPAAAKLERGIAGLEKSQPR